MIRPFSLSAALTLLLTFALPASAQPTTSPSTQPAGGANAQSETHRPVAVRWWGQGLVTVETWWGLTVAIDPYDPAIGYEDPGIEADLVLITHSHRDHNNPDLVKGDPTVVRGLDEGGNVQELQIALDRRPNQEQPRAGALAEMDSLSQHAIKAYTVPSFHDDQDGAQRGENAMWVIEADGARILHMGDFGQKQLTAEQIAHISYVDLLLIPVGGNYTVNGEQAAAIVEQLKPRIVVPIHYKTEPLEIDLQPAQAFLEALPERYQRVEANGNTVAVSTKEGAVDGQPRAVVLDYQPWKMPEDLAELFEEKEAAQQRAAEVYRPLSANQMNFRPSDGTHTPRWNVEHTNAYELSMLSGFFTAADPEMSRITDRPAQMPSDYVPANPQWTGAEEARQIERSRDFSRRFAYLLDGQSLDAQAEGVRLPLGRALEVLAGHYDEHTNNVKKKFEASDWPAE